MTLAVNHAGFNVERLLPTVGWQPVTPAPFATRVAAITHMATMDQSCAELRVYEALA